MKNIRSSFTIIHIDSVGIKNKFCCTEYVIPTAKLLKKSKQNGRYTFIINNALLVIQQNFYIKIKKSNKNLYQ